MADSPENRVKRALVAKRQAPRGVVKAPNDVIVKTLKMAAARGIPLRQCFVLAGLSDQTFLRYQRLVTDEPESATAHFMSEMQQIIVTAQLEILDEVRRASTGGPDQHGVWKNNWQAGAWLLKKFDPNHFGDRQAIDVKHTHIEGRIDPRQLSDEELERVHQLVASLKPSAQEDEVVDTEIVQPPD